MKWNQEPDAVILGAVIILMIKSQKTHTVSLTGSAQFISLWS